MKLEPSPFNVVAWAELEAVRHDGTTGFATWRTHRLGAVRIRMVEYSPGYLADHWCEKGHVLLCLAGELHTELADGQRFRLTPGTSYQVGDGASSHRSSTEVGATVFIVD